MLEITPYKLEEVKAELRAKAIESLGITDAEFDGSNLSQIVDLLAYSAVINNTNLTFGLNEMFLSQAKDAMNIQKHARQMGYNPKRKISYQYKIRLKAIEDGILSVNKYDTFSDGNNDYVYLGTNIIKEFGDYAVLELLTNEYNNALDGNTFYSSIDGILEGDYVVTEDGTIAEVLKKINETGNRKLLLKNLNDIPLNTYSAVKSDLYVKGETFDGVTDTDYIKVAYINTFKVDLIANELKIQLSVNEDVEFPVYTKIYDLDKVIFNHGTVEAPIYMIDNTEVTDWPIRSIERIELVEDDGQGGEILTEIDLNSLQYPVPASTGEEERGVIFQNENVDIIEDLTATLVAQNGYEFTTTHNILADSIEQVTLTFPDLVRIVLVEDLTIVDNTITVPEVLDDQSEYLIEIGDTVSGQFDTNKYIKSITSITVDKGVDGLVPISLSTVSFVNSTVDFGVADYDAYQVNIVYVSKEVEATVPVEIGYTYAVDLLGQTVRIDYSYDKDVDGNLDKKFFTDDLKYNVEDINNTFEGFTAKAFDPETNILTFDISTASGDLNYYLGSPMKDVIQTFKITRIAKTQINAEQDGFDPFDTTQVFSKISEVTAQDTLDLIVTEGTMRRWDEGLDIFGNGDAVNEDLTISVHDGIVDKQYITLYNEEIEENGIEMFVTRTLADGTTEEKQPWKERSFFVAEKTIGEDNSFLALTDLEFNEYLNIYTNYAGTGTPLDLTMKLRFNILQSGGSTGMATALIEPTNNDKFEGSMYNTETQIPYILNVIGADAEAADSIKENAPLFNNTANRAVTKNDYQVICNKQSFIQHAEIWGGEEQVPETKLGNVYFSLIPYSREDEYINTDSMTFELKNIEERDKFYLPTSQITDVSNPDSLFSVLDNYKVITIQFNNVQPIYIDYCIDINILKYKFGETISDTHKKIFETVKDYFFNNVEQFNTNFFRSTLSKYIDKELGDDLGFDFNIEFQTRITSENFTPVFGEQDIGEFEMFFDMQNEALFEDNIYNENGTIERYGEFLPYNLPDVSAINFITPNDEVYLDINGIVAINSFGTVLSTINSTAIKMIVPIMYKFTRRDVYTDDGVTLVYVPDVEYKIGEYIIYLDKSIISVRFFNSESKNILTASTDEFGDTIYESKEVFLQSDDTPVTANIPVYQTVGEIGYTGEFGALPKLAFFDDIRKLTILPKNDNIKLKRNSFSRLYKVEFTTSL